MFHRQRQQQRHAHRAARARIPICLRGMRHYSRIKVSDRELDLSIHGTADGMALRRGIGPGTRMSSHARTHAINLDFGSSDIGSAQPTARSAPSAFGLRASKSPGTASNLMRVLESHCWARAMVGRWAWAWAWVVRGGAWPQTQSPFRGAVCALSNSMLRGSSGGGGGAGRWS